MENISELTDRKLPFLGNEVEEGALFNSKLLLFGEYGLLVGAMALSVPFPRFSGCLVLDPEQAQPESSAEIRKFYEHLKSDNSFRQLNYSFNLESLANDLDHGLFFRSNIPQQYGVGSSGALVAALFSRYAIPSVDGKEFSPERLKNDFALLESYFHGKSSGLDPLISYLNLALLIDSKKAIQYVQPDWIQLGLSVALIDTRMIGATGPLVQRFIGNYTNQKFKTAVDSQLIPANNGCIESLLEGRQTDFFQFLEQLIRFQMKFMDSMIPEGFYALISEALDQKIFIKLLGSGGGGFLLVFAQSENHLITWGREQNLMLEMVV